ncbi:MAG: hypothetical protein ACYTDT_05535 [Planctomycetota bacterium]|jgi:predicted hotdog family 3-hydroxylacyl-ACP dehydratase
MTREFLQLIPHRAPMVLLDDITEYGRELIVGQFTIREDNPFIEDGNFCREALIEAAAQVIAAGDSLYAKSKGGKVIRGFLTGLTSLKFLSDVALGETVEIQGKCLRRMEGMGLFEVMAKVAERQILSGRFKLFVEIDYDGEINPPSKSG